MPTRTPPDDPAVVASPPSNFASRRAERLRAEAAGEVEPAKPYRSRTSLRVGDDADGSNLRITHVQQ